MTAFLPSDYEVPAGNERYLKFKKEGKYRFRVLSPAIVGYELWTNHMPVRKLKNEFSTDERESADINKNTGKVSQPAHFWMFAVWHEGTVKILQLNQASIQKQISALVSEEDWGNPMEYDLVVKRDDSGEITQYTVQPAPKKELDSVASAAWKAMTDEGFDLQAIFSGKDPFMTKGHEAKVVTPVATDEINIDDIPF